MYRVWGFELAVQGLGFVRLWEGGVDILIRRTPHAVIVVEQEF